MPLRDTAGFAYFHLAHAARLKVFDEFWPVHDLHYRHCDKNVNRQCDCSFYDNGDMGEPLGSRLKTTRLELGLTQVQLAAKARVQQSVISDLETGRFASSTDLPQIAEALGVRAMWLDAGKLPKYEGRLPEHIDRVVQIMHTLPVEKQEKIADFVESFIGA